MEESEDFAEKYKKYRYDYRWDHYTYTDDCKVMFEKIFQFLEDYKDERINFDTLASSLAIPSSTMSGFIRCLVALGLLRVEKFHSVFIFLPDNYEKLKHSKTSTSISVDQNLADKFVKLVNVKKKELYDQNENG
jgi:hypothetical protein